MTERKSLPSLRGSSCLSRVTLMRHCCVFIGAGAILLTQGCAGSSKHIVAPSTVGSNRAIAGARESNANAQRQNDIARGTLERIDAKTLVIRKYWPK